METAEPEAEYLIGQISFTDAATGEDYLIGHYRQRTDITLIVPALILMMTMRQKQHLL